MHTVNVHKEFPDWKAFERWKEEEETSTFTSFVQPKGETNGCENGNVCVSYQDFIKCDWISVKLNKLHISGKIKLTLPVDSYTAILLAYTLNIFQTTQGWFYIADIFSESCDRLKCRTCEGPGFMRKSVVNLCLYSYSWPNVFCAVFAVYQLLRSQYSPLILSLESIRHFEV